MHTFSCLGLRPVFLYHPGTSDQPPQSVFLREKTVWLAEQHQFLFCKRFSKQKLNGELTIFKVFSNLSNSMILRFCGSILESQNYRIACTGLEGILKISQFRPPHTLPWADRTPAAQAAQNPSSLALSTSKDGAPTLLWAAVPGPHCPLPLLGSTQPYVLLHQTSPGN